MANGRKAKSLSTAKCCTVGAARRKVVMDRAGQSRDGEEVLGAWPDDK